MTVAQRLSRLDGEVVDVATSTVGEGLTSAYSCLVAHADDRSRWIITAPHAVTAWGFLDMRRNICHAETQGIFNELPDDSRAGARCCPNPDKCKGEECGECETRRRESTHGARVTALGLGIPEAGGQLVGEQACPTQENGRNRLTGPNRPSVVVAIPAVIGRLGLGMSRNTPRYDVTTGGLS